MKHNVLWIMTDQHQATALGCMGNPHIQTPHLDRLAGGGVLFTNAFCQSPVCMASRGSVFTGRYPEAIRVRGMGVLPPTETTFPESLRRAGYHTGGFGKVHFTPQQYTIKELKSQHPSLDWRDFAKDAAIPEMPDDPVKADYGFAEYVGDEDALRGPFNDWLRDVAPELADKPRPAPLPDAPRDLFVSPYPSSHHPTTFVANHAIDFIERQQGDQPWMALCSFVAPHHPFEAPADQLERYPLADMPLSQRKGGVDMQNVPEPLQQAIDEIDQFSEDTQRRILQHYYAAISLIDDNVGRLLDTLEATGKIDNTVVVFVADHGEFAGNHGLLRKPSFHYDETVRVPLIIKAPGVPSRRNIGLVELVDIVPTLLGLTETAPPPGIQGIDWSTQLRDGQPIARPDIYSDMYHLDPMTHAKASGPYTACQTLRTADWKLNIYPLAAEPTGQLFHLASDPDESTDLFHDPAHRTQRDAMMWRLQQRVHQNTDPLPLRLTQW